MQRRMMWRNVSLAVSIRARPNKAVRCLNAFRATDYFSLAYEVNSEKELALLIDGGKARTGLIIPPDYGDQDLAWASRFGSVHH